MTSNLPITEKRNPSEPWRIAIAAGSILVLELALIRLIPAELHAIGYFTNLVLMATFFGLGIGCILQKKRFIWWQLPTGLTLLGSLIIAGRGVVVYEGSTPVHFWGAAQFGAERSLELPLAPTAILVFVLAAMPFLALGQVLAREMDRFPRLVAYGWDIGGSLVGTIILVVGSWQGIPPWVWPPVVSAVFAALFVQKTRARLFCIGAGLIFLGLSYSPVDRAWSPYYYIQHESVFEGERVWVNSSFHQLALDFTSSDERHRVMQDHMLQKWSIPYATYGDLHEGRQPARILILGAGTGNDVHVALQRGAEEVTAVEIDPVILGIGRESPTNPYGDPRVTIVNDDARHFLRTSSAGPFDLIVFGTLDSQALLSGHANLRLENYVYTQESLEDARRLLAPGGLVAVFYSVSKPWLFQRIFATVRSVFGDASRLIVFPKTFLFNTLVLGSADPAALQADPETIRSFGDGVPATDDWPFIYLERRTIAPIYQVVLAVVGLLIAATLVLLRRSSQDRRLHLDFLFLGVGFTLMESSAVVRLALVFGSTWTVNAVVFSGVLSTIFLANLAVLRERAPRIEIAWSVLAGAVILNYAFPLDHLLLLPAPARVVGAGILVGLPVFAASICFSRLFEKQPSTGLPLGVNLVGAMAGGLVEYVSMLTGLRAVWLIVLGVYSLAWLASRRTPA